MKRPPSAFSYVKNLGAGEEVSVPPDKDYAIRHAVAYLEAEYGYDYIISSSGVGITVKRIS